MVNHLFQIEIEHRFMSGFDLQVRLHANDSVIGLMGPSGSGKSSLLLALAGVLEPDQAIIRFKEQQFADASQRMPPRRRNIGLITQDALLFPHLSVAENLCFGPGKPKPLAPEDPIIHMLEIEHLLNRNPRQLSGGERQRVALGRALLSKPQLLLADEPFSALDQELKGRLITRLRQHISDTSMAVLLSTHDAEVVKQLCSTTVHIASGTLHHKE